VVVVVCIVILIGYAFIQSAIDKNNRFNSPVESLRFFESGYGEVSREQRSYASRFAQSESRYINWELNLAHGTRGGADYHFVINANWYKADGTILATQTVQSYIKPNWSKSFHNLGWGYGDAGKWAVGSYRVDLYIQDNKVASGTFEIYTEEVQNETPMIESQASETSDETTSPDLSSNGKRNEVNTSDKETDPEVRSEGSQPPQSELFSRPRQVFSSGVRSEDSQSSQFIEGKSNKEIPYQGPPTGVIIWSGELERDGGIVFERNTVSSGQLYQGEIPGVPISIYKIEPTYLEIIERPGPSNGWARLILRSTKNKRSVVYIYWSVL
jgi:hypothetical protein